MKRTYHLTVYFVEHKESSDGSGVICHSIADKSFTDLWEMVEFCAAFDTDNYEFLFDVWTEEDGQVNINQGVELYRESVKQLQNDFH